MLKCTEIDLSSENLGKATRSHIKQTWNASKLQFHEMQVVHFYPCRTKISAEGEGEGEVAFFSVKCLDRRNRGDQIEPATPCHDAQVVGSRRVSNSLRLTVLAAMSEDYTTAPQNLQGRPLKMSC